MNEEFPRSTNKYLKAEMFQDCPVSLTYLGWSKKANEDSKSGKWKDKLKYQLRYSYPEFATDQYGARRLGNDGQPFQNKYWDKDYPQGYSIVYHFDQGELESGSLPLFEGFCMVRPVKGDIITLTRTGKDKETKWSVKKSSSTVATLPERNELEPDNEVPF